MITSLTINNFLSHKHSEFSFVNGINVLVGLSDSGKSAVMNALRWVLTNEPSGDSFRSWWSSTVDVTIVLDNTHEITRFRNEEGNGYSYRDLTKDKEKSVFLAIKTGVPDEIAKILNIDETNIQTQLSSHFLLSNTPGEVARHFNKVAKLDKIDLANSNINSWINSINQDVKYKAEELKKNTDKLTSFDYLEKLEIDVEVLEDMYGQFIVMQTNAKKLERNIVKLETIESKIESFQGLLGFEQSIADILDLYSKRKEIATQYTKLNTLIEDIGAIQVDITENEKLTSMGVYVDSILSLSSEKYEKQKEYDKLKKLVSAIDKIKVGLEVEEQLCFDLQDEFDKAMPNKCPLCDTILTKSK
jgi:exonuclease SbcC